MEQKMKLKLAVKDVPNQKVHQNERDLNQKIEGNVERDQGITIYKKPGLPRFSKNGLPNSP